MTRCLRGWPCIGVLSRLQINPVQRGCCAKKHAAPCTTIRKTPLHVPDMGPHSRQGLSNIIDAPTSPKGVACSPLSEITCLPHRPQCPTRRKAYAADRSETMPHGGHKNEHPHTICCMGVQYAKIRFITYYYTSILDPGKGGYSQEHRDNV